MSERKKLDGSKWAGARKGVACGKCGGRASHVYRVKNGDGRITRVRQCLACSNTTDTIEVDAEAFRALELAARES